MASAIDLDEAEGTQVQRASAALPGMATLLRRALDRTCAKRFGLVVVTGPGAGHTLAMLGECGVAIQGSLDDRDVLENALAAAEQRLVAAPAEGGNAISTLLALRKLAGDRFAFAAMLRLVLAQRTAPRLCGTCRLPEQAYGSLSALLGLDPGAILWSAPGCEACAGTGHAGDLSIFEGIEVDPAMRRLIYDGADAPLLARHAFLTLPSLASAARALARDGTMAAEYAVRISRE
jgi:general secretion pathway protein E